MLRIIQTSQTILKPAEPVNLNTEWIAMNKKLSLESKSCSGESAPVSWRSELR